MLDVAFYLLEVNEFIFLCLLPFAHSRSFRNQSCTLIKSNLEMLRFRSDQVLFSRRERGPAALACSVRALKGFCCFIPKL